MIYVYAIGDFDASREGVRGLDDRPLREVRADALTAFVMDASEAPTDPDVEALWTHNRVVSALMGAGSGVLPMRFGTVLGGDEPLRRVLEARRDDFRARLARVRGRVEFGARARWRTVPDADHPRGGLEFMRAKLERQRADRRVRDDLHPRLAELAAESRCKLSPAEGDAFASSYLVDRPLGAEFARRFVRAQPECLDVELVVSGPWPPYSFSGSNE